MVHAVDPATGETCWRRCQTGRRRTVPRRRRGQRVGAQQPRRHGVAGGSRRAGGDGDDPGERRCRSTAATSRSAVARCACNSWRLAARAGGVDAMATRSMRRRTTAVARFGPSQGSGSVAANDDAVWISAHDVADGVSSRGRVRRSAVSADADARRGVRGEAFVLGERDHARRHPPHGALVGLGDGRALEERLDGDAGADVREAARGQRRRAADDEVRRAERRVLADEDLAGVDEQIDRFDFQRSDRRRAGGARARSGWRRPRRSPASRRARSHR